MSREGYRISVEMTGRFFMRTIECLEEKDSSFRPAEGMFSVAEQVAHTAQCIEWFLNGAFSPEGMSEDFEGMEREVRECKSLEAARNWMQHAIEEAVAKIQSTSDEDWMQPIAEGIMGGSPRFSIISGITDHCAHHRGALTVYARLLGKVAAMPYE